VRDCKSFEKEIFGFVKQKVISKKNIARLEQLQQSNTPHIAEIAGLVASMAKIQPHKRRRIKRLAREHPGLLNALYTNGMIPDSWEHYPITNNEPPTREDLAFDAWFCYL